MWVFYNKEHTGIKAIRRENIRCCRKLDMSLKHRLWTRHYHTVSVYIEDLIQFISVAITLSYSVSDHMYSLVYPDPTQEAPSRLASCGFGMCSTSFTTVLLNFLTWSLVILATTCYLLATTYRCSRPKWQESSVWTFWAYSAGLAHLRGTCHLSASWHRRQSYLSFSRINLLYFPFIINNIMICNLRNSTSSTSSSGVLEAFNRNDATATS